MRGMFRREFDLFLATDGEAAVNITSNNQIDVIVADQRMPGMSGTELLGKVKDLSPDTVRILLTGYADPNAVEDSINYGEVFRFLGKPCPPKVLRDTLKVAINAARLSSPDSRPQRARPLNEIPLARDTLPPATNSEIEKAAMDLPDLPPYVQSAREDRNGTAARPAVVAKEVGVILYTVDPQFAETAIRAVSMERSTSLATSLLKVMQHMEKEGTGVLVTDVTNNDLRLQGIIAALKRYVPELVTIVVSNNRDTSDMINLINGGQIFRFLRKPVTTAQLRTSIAAAALKHQSLRNNSDLLQRHSVAQIPGQYELPAAEVSTLSKLQEIRSRHDSLNDSLSA